MGFFGYQAVGKIKLVQRHAALRPKQAPRAVVSALTHAEIQTSVARINNCELAAALQSLGSAMRANT